jgi:hypothetical protein
LYNHPVRLSEHAIDGLNYAPEISEAQFNALLAAANGMSDFVAGVKLPDSERNWGFVYSLAKQRLGQGVFRKGLLDAYDGTCAISGCRVADVLEAAHIFRWSESGSQTSSNGLLLRADIHSLFDADLIGIDPERLLVQLAAPIRESEYGVFHGAKLRVPADPKSRPNKELLKQRWRAFLDRLERR